MDRYTAFADHTIVARGDLTDVVRAVHGVSDATILIFEDSTGRQAELDLRGSLEDALSRLPPSPPEPLKPTRGRPRLGVTAREVTLLPRHWEWLAEQPGGASAALRRLVEQARKDGGDTTAARRALDVTYRAMTVLAGDLPGYEEAIRALFAGDRDRFVEQVATWPHDVATYVVDLAGQVDAPTPD